MIKAHSDLLLETIDGERRGRDPRTLTAAELEAAGLRPSSLLGAVRAKCVDCSGGSEPEARRCTAVKCPLWPFRMRKNPWRAPMSDERREASRRRLLAMRGLPIGAESDAAADETEEDFF